MIHYAAPHVGRALACVVALLAWRVTHYRPQHRPLAAYLTAIAAADLARWVIGPTHGDPALRYGLGLLFDSAGPYAGALRVAFHVDEALYLVGPVGLAMVAIRVLAGRRPDHVVGAGALLWVALVATYPATRGAMLTDRIYPAAEWASVATVGLATALWWRGRPPRWPGFPEVLTWMYGATVVSLLVAGPFAMANPVAAWWSGWGALFSLQVASAALHAAWYRSVRAY